MAIASMILGIIALVISVFSFGVLGIFGGIIAIVALVLGILGRNELDRRGMAIAGIVCSSIALGMSFIFFFLVVGFGLLLF